MAVKGFREIRAQSINKYLEVIFYTHFELTYVS